MPDKREIDINKLKLIFFDPQCGGSHEAEQVIRSLVDAHKRMYAYINKRMPGHVQHATEEELRADGAGDGFTSTDHLREIISDVLKLHPDSDSPLLNAAITKLGLRDPEIEQSGWLPDVISESYLEVFTNRLAQHYEVEAKIAQSAGRKFP